MRNTAWLFAALFACITTPCSADNSAAEVPAASVASFSASKYCATCGDGFSHTVESVLGARTLMDLARYKSADGAQPFSFISSYPFGVLFNLQPEVTAKPGEASIVFKTSARIGTIIATSSAVHAGAAHIILTDKYVTNDRTPIAKGTAVLGPGIQADTMVNGPVTGEEGAWIAPLSKETQHRIPLGLYLTFSIQPSSGAYVLPVVSIGGINQGDVVTAESGCIPENTQVDYVNQMKGEIVLSKATTIACASDDTLSFTPSWLSHVSKGMIVMGPPGSVQAPTTVVDVNLATGVVILSKPLTGPIRADAPMLGNALSAPAQQVTFWRPYTDGEATMLEMDRVAIQAAVNDAGAAGGAVLLPGGTRWRADGPIILPISDTTPPYPRFSLGGGGSVAHIVATKDFGPGTALLSCGDPTGKSSNARGIYQGAAGYFCTGKLRGLHLGPSASVARSSAYGRRPTWNGVPIAMDGIKEGPRLDWENVYVDGFNNGALAAWDHTHIEDSSLNGNFIGLRLDDSQLNLFGDILYDRFYSVANTMAAISVSPKAFFSGEMNKPHLGYSPYIFMCEPSTVATDCIQGTTITNANFEAEGCGYIIDIGIRDGFAGSHNSGSGQAWSRTITNLRERNNYHSRGIESAPSYGCQWGAYVSVLSAAAWDVESEWSNDFPIVSGAFAHYIRADRFDGYQFTGSGGIRISGQGIWRNMQDLAVARQNIVGGFGGIRGDFIYTRSYLFTTLAGPGFVARPIPLLDSGATKLPLGSLLEVSPYHYANQVAVQRAGQNRNSPVMGVSCQDWTVNPMGQGILPVVCVGGRNIPFATIATAIPGEILSASRMEGQYGVAIESSWPDQIAGVSQSSGFSPFLTFGKAMWRGAEAAP